MLSGPPSTLDSVLDSPDSSSDSGFEDSPERSPRSNAATGASAAGARAFGMQLMAFYFRAPAKAFFRTRVDYMAFARTIHPRASDGRWSLHTTTPGLLVHAVRAYGWRFIQNQVMPPLLANAAVGAVLYTSYLQVLSGLNESVSHGVKRIYPPIPPSDTFAAGFLAGTVQSIAAAPLDALQARLTTNDLLEGRHPSMWHYGRHKLQEIGVRGIFGGWGLSFLRDSFGYGAFFSCFEYIKAQAFYAFVVRYYGSLHHHRVRDKVQKQGLDDEGVPVIKPHYAMEPSFLMAAGIVASTTSQAIQHPLSVIQNLHYGRLEYLDHQASVKQSRRRMMRHYYHAYQETWKRCHKRAGRAGGWRKWLFQGFVRRAVSQVPSTSAGLVIFETVRRKYASSGEGVYIEKDGYNILLP